MKIRSLFSVRNLILGCGVVLGGAMLSGSAVAQQNLLKNGSFENPIDPPGSPGTNNWVLVLAHGTQADFQYADRTTEACKSTDTNFLVNPPEISGGSFGAAFAARHWSDVHAYHKQIVTGLTPGAQYTLRGYMHIALDHARMHPYIVSIGDTTRSNRGTTTRTLYLQTNTATASGTIEVRVGLRQTALASVDPGQPKWFDSSSWFDVFSLTPTP